MTKIKHGVLDQVLRDTDFAMEIFLEEVYWGMGLKVNT